MIKVYIKNSSLNKVKKAIDENNPWIFSSDIDNIEGNVTSGAIVKVYDHFNEFYGTGYINLASKILVRLLTHKDIDINQEFITKRIREAKKIRETYFNADFNQEKSAYRLIFSEADYLPGLVVDKYASFLVVQITTYGMENLLPYIINGLNEIYHPSGIYLRNDEKIREKEGLPLYKKYIGKPFNPLIEIIENDIKLKVDIENGQKTGYFLDQKENRFLASRLSKGEIVLDLFSHTGAFSLNMLNGGAKKAIAVDISSDACQMIKDNAKLNNFDNIEIINEDIMVFLPRLVNEKIEFGVVILDPPAFTKTKDTIRQAYNGYKKINSLALKVVKDGGYLLTFSCSRYMERDLFIEMLKEAAINANVNVQILKETQQSLDHPMLLGLANSYYLKCFVLKVEKK